MYCDLAYLSKLMIKILYTYLGRYLENFNKEIDLGNYEEWVVAINIIY